MKHNNLKGSLILCTASLIWGLAFVAQSDAADLVPSFTFNALRSFIGAAALYLFYKVTNREKTPFFPKEKGERKQYYIAAAVCGLMLTISVNLQQFGLAAYPNGAAAEARGGFITALYVVLVPVISFFMGKKTSPVIWISVLVALGGFYLLCLSGGAGGIYIGDLLIFICAVSFSLHILSIDKFVGVTGGVKLSVMQFTVVGVLSSVLALIFERPELSNILAAAPQILYLGIMSSGVAYTLQIVGQKYAEPSVASLSMSLESVFAALGGWLIAGNTLSVKELCGCALVFAAIIAAQLPEMMASRKNNE
ncbi:MAG: DMT family transporter, partial [Acutalibacteraceae bacterium]